ncbi:MAG: hypothetical protein FJ280_05670 [Planctomycetes bacterium]|nr:hypothetical protein [Planctomycetota bacterium]
MRSRAARKSETRNSKFETNPEGKKTGRKTQTLAPAESRFEFSSVLKIRIDLSAGAVCFGFRISDFELPASGRRFGHR